MQKEKIWFRLSCNNIKVFNILYKICQKLKKKKKCLILILLTSFYFHAVNSTQNKSTAMKPLHSKIIKPLHHKL